MGIFCRYIIKSSNILGYNLNLIGTAMLHLLRSTSLLNFDAV